MNKEMVFKYKNVIAPYPFSLLGRKYLREKKKEQYIALGDALRFFVLDLVNLMHLDFSKAIVLKL